MPTYEYRCPAGHDAEDFVLKISDAKPEIPCPVCGVMAPRRVSAGSGLLFKGSGFYITDYGKDGKKDQRSGTKPADAPAPTPSTPSATPPATTPAPTASPAASTPKSGPTT